MSKLRVNDVIPANGLNIGIGTAGGNFIVGGASTTVVVNGSVNSTGTISASTFIGDGSGLTGVTASGSGINIKDSASTVGVAATIDFGTNLNVSPASAGIVTVTVGDTDFAIADKIIHTGDTNTAIRFPADDTFTVETGGDERLRIDSNGKLILKPGADYGNILQLNGADTTSEILELGINATGYAQITATHASGGSNACGFIIRTRHTSGGTTEKLRITSGGLVGIGTENPAHKLDVIGGNIRVGKTSNGQFIGENNSGTVKIKLDTDGNSHLSGGNLGIGTDNPNSNLHVFGTNGIRITNSANQSATTLLNFESNHPAFRMLNTSGHTTVKFKSDGDSFITSGNLGIGTDTPTNFGGSVKLALSDSGNSVLSIAAGTSSDSSILFADGTSGDSTYRGNIKYAHSDDSMRIHTAAEERFRITSGGDIGIANTSPTSWGSGVPTVEIKGDASSQPTRGGFLGFESYSGTDGYGGLWLDNDQLKFYIGESRTAGDSSYVTPTERLRIAYADYPYIGISTSGTFRDQRLPLSIHGRGFGHGWTQQGTTQDAVYLTAGASGNYSTLTLTVNKVSWGSIAYEIHAAAYNTKHLHRVGGFYQNGTGISGDTGNTVKSSGTTFAISGAGSQQFTMTISGGTWTHPSAWVRLVLSGSGYLRSDLITFRWS